MTYNIGGYYRYISMGGSLITIVAAMILAILLALPLYVTPGESLSTYDDPALLAMIFFTCAFYGVGVLLIILSNRIECKIRAGMLKVSKYTLSKSGCKDSISSMLDTIKKRKLPLNMTKLSRLYTIGEREISLLNLVKGKKGE